MEKWPRNPLTFVYAASVPHHGALRTMNRNTSVEKPDLRDLIWFTDYTRPTSIYASAGIKNTHSHPYRIVLETMGRYATAQQFQQRPIVVFNGGTSQFEILPDIRNNIYTTVLNLTTPAVTANWTFNITPIATATGIQLFNAGVPGILSAPQLSEMELAAQRINAERTKTWTWRRSTLTTLPLPVAQSCGDRQLPPTEGLPSRPPLSHRCRGRRIARLQCGRTTGHKQPPAPRATKVAAPRRHDGCVPARQPADRPSRPLQTEFKNVRHQSLRRLCPRCRGRHDWRGHPSADGQACGDARRRRTAADPGQCRTIGDVGAPDRRHDLGGRNRLGTGHDRHGRRVWGATFSPCR